MIRRVKKKRRLNSEINVVPYIDVMMVLLVIFMVTAPIMTQVVDVDLPEAGADPVEQEDTEQLIVSVDREGLYYVNVGGEETDPVSAEEVATRVGKILNANPQKMVYVRGDKTVSYDHVITLMALLQGAGATSVGLVTE